MKKMLFITALFIAISTNAQNNADSIPNWFSKPPVSNKVFYGVGVGRSSSMDIAEKKAILSANLQIAEQVEPAKVEKIKKTTKTASGRTTEDIIQREIVNVILSDVKIVKKVLTQNGDEYTVYIMSEMKKKR